MPDLDLHDYVRFIDWYRKTSAPMRERVVLREYDGGWLSVRPGEPIGENPSASTQRVQWLTRREPLTRGTVDAAVEALRRERCAGAFFCLSPWCCTGGTVEMLRGLGATEWPYVQYVGLARPAGRVEDPRESPVTVRPLAMGEIDGFIAAVKPWGSEEYGGNVKRQVPVMPMEVFGAFVGDRPAGIALLTVHGDYGYLGSAWTAADMRGKGAQTALIRARCERAAERGAGWVAVETNTVVDGSLRNLKRCGFSVVLTWRVFKWEDPAITPTA